MKTQIFPDPDRPASAQPEKAVSPEAVGLPAGTESSAPETAAAAPDPAKPADPAQAGEPAKPIAESGAEPAAKPAAKPAAPRALAFRGRAFKAMALKPEAPLADWLADLDAALKRSPTLFDGRAIILDLGALRPDHEALQALVADLLGRRVRILGFEGVESIAAGLPPLLVGGRPASNLDLPDLAPPTVPAEPVSTSITIEGSVRSGQTVVHPTGDVTVMGSVSSGAEILAGGSIHIYGALRGRAIAGAARNPRARIYCRKFQPELLGIDRLVRTAEDIGTQLQGKPAQIWLDGGAIRMASLD